MAGLVIIFCGTFVSILDVFLIKKKQIHFAVESIVLKDYSDKEKINDIWLKKFTKKLFFLQKKYNLFLIGGDLSTSHKIIISSNFFGFVSKGKILTRTDAKINDDIWVTGNIGESSIGLKVMQKKNYY